MNTSQQAFNQNQAPSTNQTQQTGSEFFDHISSGLGYLNSIREVQTKKGKYLACKIAALYGRCTEPEYIYYDLNVTAKDAEHLVRRCIAACDAKRKVLVGFSVGDAHPKIFNFSNPEKQGQQGVSMKGRLLSIGWIKIDGSMVYKAEKKNQSDIQTQAPVVNNEAPPAAATSTNTQAAPQTAQASATVTPQPDVPVEVAAEAVADSFEVTGTNETTTVTDSFEVASTNETTTVVDSFDVPAEVVADSFEVNTPASQPTATDPNALNSTQSF